MTKISEKMEEMAKKFVRDETAQGDAIDIGALVTLIVTVMVGAIVLGALIPTFTDSISGLAAKAEEEGGELAGMTSMINLIPMLVVLIFVISVIFVLINQIRKGMK